MKTNFKDILISIVNWFVKAFKWCFSSFKNLILITSCIAAIILFFKYENIKKDYDDIVIETTDSLTVYKNKNKELYSMTEMYITDIDNLKTLNTELYNEVKSLKDNPLIITKIETKYIRDTIVMVDTLYKDPIIDDAYKSKFSFEDDWTEICGTNVFNTKKLLSQTSIDHIAFNTNLTLDVVEKNKKLMFIAKSDNPYLQINNMDGIILSPEKSKVLKKRYNKPWCLVIGVGPAVTVVSNKVRILPAAQLTFGYKIISF